MEKLSDRGRMAHNRGEITLRSGPRRTAETHQCSLRSQCNHWVDWRDRSMNKCFWTFTLMLPFCVAPVSLWADELNGEAVEPPISSTLNVYAKRIDNIRSGPGIKHRILRQTKPHERIKCESKMGRWYKLMADEGAADAWVHDSVVYTEAEFRENELFAIGRHLPPSRLPCGPTSSTRAAPHGTRSTPSSSAT